MMRGKHRSVLILVLTAAWALGGLAQGSDPSTWPVVFEDDFTDPESGWWVGEDEYRTHRYVDGGYEIVVHTPWRLSYAWLPEGRDYLDFAIEVEAQRAEGQGELGVILRWDGNAGYFVTLGTDGGYRVRLYRAGAWRTLQDWTQAPGFRHEGANRLALVAQGSTFTAWLNGQPLTSFTDETARGGRVALVVGTMEAGGHDVRCERVAVREDMGVRARAEQAAALRTEARARYEGWELEEAARLFREALELYRELEWRKREGDALLDLGRCYWELGDHRTAIESHKAALEILRSMGNWAGVAWVLYGLGVWQVELANYLGALLLLQQSEGYFIRHQDRSGEAASKFQLAECYLELGDFARAVDLYRRSVTLFRDVGNPESEAVCLNRLGYCYYLLGDYRQALRCHSDALALVHASTLHPEELKALQGLGDCYYRLGDFEQATAFYDSALEIGRAIQDWRRVAFVMVGLGNCATEQGQYRSAIELYHASLESFHVAGYALGGAVGRANIAECYRRLGECDRAIPYLEEAASVFRQLGNDPGQANAHLVLGECYRLIGEYGLAVAAYLVSLSVLKDAADLLDLYLSVPPREPDYLRNSGFAVHMVLTAQSSPTEEQLLELSTKGYEVCGTAGRFVLASAPASLILDIERGVETLDWVVTVALPPPVEEAHGVAHPEILWRVHSGMGCSLWLSGSLRGAAESMMTAVEIVETLRGWLGNADHMASFMRAKFTLYHDLVRVLTTLDQPDEALFFAERAKARTLVDMMDMAMALRRDALPSDLQEPAELVVALGALEAQAADPLVVGAVAEVRTGAGRAALLTREAFDALRGQLCMENPHLCTLLAVDPAQIQAYMNAVQKALGAGTVALEYFVTRDETLLWVITRDGIQHVHRIEITRAELALKARAFREAMDEEADAPPEQAESGRAARLQRVLELGQELYGILLGPVEPYLEGATHLVVIPSDVLFYVPFAALVRCPGCEGAKLFWEGEYLIERTTVSYAPSLASLYWPLQRRQEATPYTSALVVGNPTRDLPYAEKEARAVAALFPTGQILLREEGTKDEVVGRLTTTPYDVVHLSTHGLFDREVALGSGVALANNGLLTAVEILGLRLPAQLAVLSACQTALPPDVEESLVVGDELQGLSQALFVAGVPSSVLTLWDVNDRSTSVLMAGEAGMYGHLLRGETRAEALRRAQRALMADPTTVYRHPYYWAAFVLYGDWR